MNGVQFLGITMMGYALAPTPDDVPLYAAGGAPGVIKDGVLFAVGAGLFLLGGMKK